ncbi:Dam family site-specific DNA-(adenine-N6)-methyltransferase [Serratia marcescens]|uniref:DNA adenine methylase n=1 Tax=Serratia marcescens TaxID=615 RepID=UPI003208E38B
MLNSALKWVGGKRRIMDILRQHLPTAPGRRLVEPFVGSAAVFLNTDFDSYLLADINGDLINFHNVAKEYPEELIGLGQLMFANHKGQEGYLAVRASFNLRIEVSNIMRAAKFLYLNRHGYNGMCRYNRRGEFNIPFGKVDAPYFPEKEIRAFAEKAKNAVFLCCDFTESIEMAAPGDVIYCDPPYMPKTKTTGFTDYHTEGFGELHQYNLMYSLRAAATRGCHVVASNSDVAEALQCYDEFEIHHITAPRSVSCKGDGRGRVGEIIATMGAAAC